MRHFFLVPKIDIKKSCQNIFDLIESEKISKEDLQTKLFNPDDNKNQNNSEEISETTLYKWKNGLNLPNLYKLIKLSLLLKKPIEEIFSYSFSYKETKVKIKSDYKSGTEIHFGIFSIHFSEEDLSINELLQKYKEDFLFYYDYNYNFYKNRYSEYYNSIDITNLIPNIDIDICKQNFSMFLKNYEKKFGKINKILIDLLDIKNAATITNWKNEKTLPEAETLLTVLWFLHTSFENLWNPIYCLPKNFKLNYKTREMYERHYHQLYNREIYLENYCKEYEKSMNNYKKKYPNYHFLFLDYEKKSLVTLINENFIISKDEISFKKEYIFVLEKDSDYFPYEVYEEESNFEVVTIDCLCEDLYRYLIYRIIKENKIFKYNGIILRCFETFLTSYY